MECKRCGRELTSKKSIELGYGLRCHRIKLLEEKQHNPLEQEFTDLKNKWNQLSLKYSILEKKLNKAIENGICIKEKTNANTEEIERIKQLQSEDTPKTPEQKNMLLVIKELKIVFQTSNFKEKLEKVPDSFLNHKNIYENIELAQVQV